MLKAPLENEILLLFAGMYIKCIDNLIGLFLWEIDTLDRILIVLKQIFQIGIKLHNNWNWNLCLIYL